MLHDELDRAKKALSEAGDPQDLAEITHVIDTALVALQQKIATLHLDKTAIKVSHHNEGALAKRDKRTEWPDIGDPNGQVW